ncbi:MAG TPA: YbaL family putative K(+) efflux transporter [Gemmatimonadaceae bacterium]|nr:YbaL family putative K(+) efflux transporter [Gemmatimonadaceae bacterium]
MPHDTALIATIAAGLGLAFLLGFVATHLRLPPLVGYLVAGVLIGPHSPGFVADVELAGQLAEVGVILLMFGVGLHFSLGDLLAVRRTVVPGAVARIIAVTPLTALVARGWGWSWGAGLIFGLALSVASTVVLLRALEERGALGTADGRIAVGWLVVEDLLMVLVLVLLPALAPSPGGAATADGTGLGAALGITLGKVAAFIALMFVVGRRAVPWLLERVARTGSHELFTLGVLAVALGVAVGAARLFGVSFALGAFLAGVVISESDLSHQAAADALPLRDAFAVLFFVSVGMLFDPAVLVREPLRVLIVVLIVVAAKSVVAFGLVLLFRHPVRTALTIAVGLAQIGEFSFILAALGTSLGIFPEEGRNLILAGALLSITLNALLFAAVDPLDRWLRDRPRLLAALERAPALAVVPASSGEPALRGHVVIVGYGRVGSIVGEAVTRQGIPFVVVERDRAIIETLRERGIPAIFGDASRAAVMGHAHPEHARLLVVATPEPYHVRQVIVQARRLNPTLEAIVRTHRPEDQEYVERLGGVRAFVGERELAFGIAYRALMSLGRGDDAADTTIQALRERARGRFAGGV